MERITHSIRKKYLLLESLESKHTADLCSSILYMLNLRKNTVDTVSLFLYLSCGSSGRTSPK